MQPVLDRLREAGAKPPHLRRLLQVWLAGRSVATEATRDHAPFPAAVARMLPSLEEELDGIAKVVSEHPSEDGGARLLLELADGRTVESVLLLRDGVCVSTQVGCAVGCTFCMTGKEGLLRQLTAAEILAQVVAARRRRHVRRVVFMGMGEPAHNLPAVLEALTLLGNEGRLGHKELVFSTVGEPKVFEQLAAHDVRPALALSLHTTHAALRVNLLPRAPRVEPRELVDHALDYAARTGHPLQVQWTLLAGVNDGDDELQRLVEWFRGRRAVVNFIPYNPVAGFDHRRTSRERARAMTRTLHKAGIHAKLRHSVGADVDAACGQLRARAVAGTSG